MRLALLGLCVISLIQIALAVQPLDLDQLMELTDDEDLIHMLRAKRHATNIRRVRRETPQNAPFANPSQVGDDSATIAFADQGSTEDEGSGTGSGGGPDDNFST